MCGRRRGCPIRSAPPASRLTVPRQPAAPHPRFFRRAATPASMSARARSGPPRPTGVKFDITLVLSHRGRGASRVVLDALRARAAALGYRRLFAPVRPTAKHLEPATPMAEYVARSTADGLPAAPWLRVHVCAG